jgi:signal peptidase I
MFNKNKYSLRKCKKILRHSYIIYKRKKNSLNKVDQKRIENIIIFLQSAIIKKEKVSAIRLAKNLENIISENIKTTFIDQSLNFIYAISFALIIAIVVRQTIFEFYAIPTGSMRPTLKEKDLVVVSKTSFGINVPLTTKHLYFNDNLVKRGSIVVFTSKNLDIRDSNMLYFYLFPGKKQLVKRLVGKPNDTLYFYGGKIYGMDKNDKEILELSDSIYFDKIEHIPFIKFEGNIKTLSKNPKTSNSPIMFYQMNEPIAMMNINQFGNIESELITTHSNVFTKDSHVNDYFDIWGFKNYAMARILSKDEVINFSSASLVNLEDEKYYLELSHHPSIKNPKIIIDEYGRLRPTFSMSTSLIPLNENHLKKVFENLTTSRFYVKNSYAYRYGSKPNNNLYLPKLNTPDGLYEFINGTAYSVNALGITKKLSKDHPINIFSTQNAITLFNLGVEFNTLFSAMRKHQTLLPSRYAYFKDSSLYLMGREIFKKEDPNLINFLNKEREKVSFASENNPYFAFEDLGTPLNEDKSLNKEFIKKYGIKIPDNMYLVLGDNHANSGDSRDFGFVPKENFKGVASFIFYPPSSRWGRLFQPNLEIFTFPKLIVYSFTTIIIVGSYLFIRRKYRSKLKF